MIFFTKAKNHNMYISIFYLFKTIAHFLKNNKEKSKKFYSLKALTYCMRENRIDILYLNKIDPPEKSEKIYV